MNNSINSDEPTVIDCKSLEKFVVDYLDGQLPDHVNASFLQHIEECGPCESYFRDYKKTISLSKAALSDSPATEKVELPEEMIQAILAASGKS